MKSKGNLPVETAQFDDHGIRKAWHDEEWHFAVTDVLGALTESSNPRRYWTDLKRKLTKVEGFAQLYENIVRLKLPSADGKMRQTECANTRTLLRIVQSVPSPKAEPFKLWLSRVGYERLQENEDPEIAIERVRQTYRAKGYSEEWIDKRLESVSIRKELTDEWKQRGVKEGQEYAKLTGIISKGTFDLTPSEHKKLKSLKKAHNLRDHMSSTELVLTMLGETVTTDITRNEDAQGYEENEQAAQKGGRLAGNTRKAIEAETGKKVVSKTNFLGLNKLKGLFSTDDSTGEENPQD